MLVMLVYVGLVYDVRPSLVLLRFWFTEPIEDLSGFPAMSFGVFIPLEAIIFVL